LEAKKNFAKDGWLCIPIVRNLTRGEEKGTKSQDSEQEKEELGPNRQGAEAVILTEGENPCTDLGNR
jgi:hypothetical protein